MITSILVYGFMMFSTYHIGIRARNKYSFLTLFLMLGIFVFFSAVRYDVGVDNLSYIEIYNYTLQFGNVLREDMEIGFVSLMELIGFFNCPYQLFLGTVALLQISFLFLAFRNEKYIYPYLILFLLATGYYFSWMNGVRQIIAITIIIYAISFKSLWKQLLISSCAILFHTSAFIMLPLIIICYYWSNIWIKNSNTRVILIIGAQIIPLFINMEFIFKPLDIIMGFIGYERYADASSIITQNEQSLALGPRYFILVITGIIISIYANKISKYYKETLFTKIYNLYFLGLILTPIMRFSLHLMRFLMYFNELTFIVAAYTFCYMQRRKPNNVNNWLFFMLACMYLILTLLTSKETDHILYQFSFGK